MARLERNALIAKGAALMARLERNALIAGELH